MTVHAFAELETVFLAIVLVLAAATKVAQRNTLEGTELLYGIGKLPGAVRVRLWYGIAFLELALACALLAVPGRTVDLTVLVFFVGASALLAIAKKRAPESACGCFGLTPGITAGSVARSTGFMLLALYCATRWPSAGPHFGAFAGGGVIGVQTLAVLLAVARVPSPRGWRGVLLRLRTPRCLTATQTVYWALAVARRTRLWEDASKWITSATASDHWREGCWRFLAFDADHEGSAASLVFAVHLPPTARTVKASLVDNDGTVLWHASEKRPRIERIRETELAELRHAVAT